VSRYAILQLYSVAIPVLEKKEGATVTLPRSSEPPPQGPDEARRGEEKRKALREAGMAFLVPDKVFCYRDNHTRFVISEP
jgi:hypothetical protein